MIRLEALERFLTSCNSVTQNRLSQLIIQDTDEEIRVSGLEDIKCKLEKLIFNDPYNEYFVILIENDKNFIQSINHETINGSFYVERHWQLSDNEHDFVQRKAIDINSHSDSISPDMVVQLFVDFITGKNTLEGKIAWEELDL